MARDDDRRDGGFGFGSIEEFLERFVQLQRRIEESENVDVETSFSYRVGGMGPGAPGRKGHPRNDRRPTQGEPGDRIPTVDADGLSAGPDVLTTVSEGPDGPVLTCDLSGTGVTEVADLSVSVTDGVVTVAREDGTVLVTEPVDAESLEGIRFNNGLLEVELRGA
jgi:hypothetical protein